MTAVPGEQADMGAAIATGDVLDFGCSGLRLLAPEANHMLNSDLRPALRGGWFLSSVSQPTTSLLFGQGALSVLSLGASSFERPSVTNS